MYILVLWHIESPYYSPHFGGWTTIMSYVYIFYHPPSPAYTYLSLTPFLLCSEQGA